MSENEPLPDILARIADATDRKTALKIADEFGGREVSLPKRLSPKSAMVKLIGREKVQCLLDAIGPGKIIIPLGPTSRGKDLAGRIDGMLRAGFSINAVAKALHIHVRTVFRRKRSQGGDGA